jgi:transposase
MSTNKEHAPKRTGSPTTRLGVGIDTSRYGHYAVFLRHDLQDAAAELSFAESADGYGKLRTQLEKLAVRHPDASFSIRIDVAGPYADNLLHFLHHLAEPTPSNASPLTGRTSAVSFGDPLRNKNYRAALFGARKSDPIEARACARFAIAERPAGVPPLSPAFRALRQTAKRLHAVVRQRTRLINQLHLLLVPAFPELALFVKDISVGWVLELLDRYPTATLLGQADEAALTTVAYLPHDRINELLSLARSSIGSLTDATMAELVRDQVRQLRDVNARQQRLERLVVRAYQALPKPNHLHSIPGIGDVTAALLTAYIVDIKRFATPNKLTAYFGTMPIEVSSGVERDGQPRPAARHVMCKRGNDLVRRYLWMAALSAVQHNPAVRALYARVAAKHPEHRAIAIGHAMRKLLHLVFAVWTTGKSFDPDHFPWQGPKTTAADPAGAAAHEGEQAAGHKPESKPAKEVVTATCTDKVAAAAGGEGTYIDFAHLKQQLPLERVLTHLGLAERLRGFGSQRRCTCPLHRGDGRGRTFSVNLKTDVFKCFDKRCAKEGDVIDLWAALHHLELRAAAVDLIRTFNLEPAPARRTEKRNG